jgi:hypothetical protein
MNVIDLRITAQLKEIAELKREAALFSEAADEIEKLQAKLKDRFMIDQAIKEVLDIVDNMGERRRELMEEAVKEIDRRLFSMREQREADNTLEGKLAIIKQERELESIRKQRRDRMFELIDDGAIYAHAPLERHELIALVKILRDAVCA